VIEPSLERRLPLPPLLTRRVGVLGVLAFVLFGVVAFRLWYLQVLTGPQNVALATANVERSIPIPAPRGEILDRNGNVLAGTTGAARVSIVADDLPGAKDATLTEAASDPRRLALYDRLARVLGVTPGYIAAIVNGKQTPGYQPAVIQNDVGTYALYYLGLHPNAFPGVDVQRISLRDYPQGDIGSVVLGQIGPIAKNELGTSPFQGIQQGTYVGQAGLESTYQPYLQGKDGVEKVQVNASGVLTGKAPVVTQPTSGDTLLTSLDLGLEREGYEALRRAMAAARGYPTHLAAPAGAFFAMDPDTGRVLAVGSLPTYNANDFVTPPSYQLWAQLDNATQAPLVDRAITSYYNTGSTFKPITALGALKGGLITAQTTQGGVDCVRLSATLCLHNSGGANLGNLDLVQALTVSEDTYFYLVGAAANGATGNGHAIQNEARELGLGQAPEIDLPGASAGLIPDRAVIDDINKAKVAQYCVPGTTRVKAHYAHAQLAINTCAQGFYDPPWTVGQNVLLATGQGYLQASPAQMAIAYSAIFNGGRVWHPQVGEKILTPSGQLARQLPAPTYRQVDVPPAYQQLIMQGLHDAAQTPSGTSDAVFGNFPYPVYGKTGTAVVTGKGDQSWYICYVPDGAKSIVVAVTIEQGGFGAAAAAPAARLMLSQWLGVKKVFLPGQSQDH
jgi:penicillin-binding protein 2